MIERFREYETLEHTGIVFGDFSLKIEYIFYKNSISASQNLSVLAQVNSILRPTLDNVYSKTFLLYVYSSNQLDINSFSNR